MSIPLIIIIGSWNEWKKRYWLFQRNAFDEIRLLFYNAVCYFSLFTIIVTIFYFQTGSQNIVKWIWYNFIVLIFCLIVEFVIRKIELLRFESPKWLNFFSWDRINAFFMRGINVKVIDASNKKLLENNPLFWLLKPQKLLITLAQYLLDTLCILVVISLLLWLFKTNAAWESQILLTVLLNFSLCYFMVSVAFLLPYILTGDRQVMHLPLLTASSYNKFQFFSLIIGYAGLLLLGAFAYYLLFYQDLGERLGISAEILHRYFRRAFIFLVLSCFGSISAILLLMMGMDINKDTESLHPGIEAFFVVFMTVIAAGIIFLNYSESPSLLINFFITFPALYMTLIFSTKILKNFNIGITVRFILYSMGYGLSISLPILLAIQGFWLENGNLLSTLPYKEMIIILSTFLAVILAWPFGRNLQAIFATPSKIS